MHTGKTKIAGVIGWPIGHSRSPRLHGFWLQKYRIDGAYLPFPVKPEDLSRALQALPALGIRGVNVTMPHKEAVFQICDELDGAAAQIGAVNTVTVSAGGQLHGANTDGFGFLENVRQAVPDWAAAGGPATVVGAGGAARSIVVAMLNENCPQIRLVNRTLSRAEAMADDLNDPRIIVRPWEERSTQLADAATLINTSNLGMQGHPNLEMDLSRLPTKAVVSDIVYVPLETDLLVAARKRGNRTVDGLGMLLHQARPGFARWFDHEPEVTADLRAHILADL